MRKTGMLSKKESDEVWKYLTFVATIVILFIYYLFKAVFYIVKSLIDIYIKYRNNKIFESNVK